MARDNFHCPTYVQESSFLQFANEIASGIRVKGARRRRDACRELVNPSPYCLCAGRVQRLLDCRIRVQGAKLAQYGFETSKKRQVNVQAQGRDVASVRVLDSNRCALDLTSIGKPVGVVGHNLWVI